VNNLLADKNSTYRARVAALKRLVLFRFSDDVTVVPRDSAWFSWQRGGELVPLQAQPLYTEDWLGLRALDEVRSL
jgi:palmitoyl-protein thioesterase